MLRKLTTTLWIPFIFILITSNVFAGPFGLEQGLTKKQIEILIQSRLNQVDTYTYKSKIAPIPNTLFAEYVYTISTKHGLCQIKATNDNIGDASTANTYATQLTNTLIKKYGNKYKQNGPMIWWEEDDGSLRDNLRLVLFSAGENNGKNAFAVLYEFRNVSKWAEEMKEADANSL